MEFRTLGNIEVIADDGTAAPTLLAQPKRLVLLRISAWRARRGRCAGPG
jgi:hypothetical protein